MNAYEGTWFETQDSFKVEAALDRYVTAGRPFNTMGVTDDYFGLWLWLADRSMSRVVGLGINDIGDWMWADAYESGQSPKSAAREALENDDTYSMMFGGE